MDNEDVTYLHNGILFNYGKRIMEFTGKWKVLEAIILSEVTQTQEDKHSIFSFI